MNKELEDKLVQKYPVILRDYGGDARTTCMAFGFQHDDGWFQIIDTTFEKIQYLCELFTKDNGSEVGLVAESIKEKFGTLRVYYHTFGTTKIQQQILDTIVSELEIESSQICEITGALGVLCQKRNWLKTLCFEEAQKYGYAACDDLR